MIATPMGKVILSRRAATVPAWWMAAGVTPVGVYLPKGAASLAASYVNLVTPGTKDAAPGTAPTLVAAGWSFAAASSRYLTTGIIPVSGYAMLIKFSSWSRPVTNNQYLAGIYTGTNFFGVATDTTSAAWLLSGSSTTTVVDAATSGVWGVAGTDRYIAGVDVGDNSGWAGGGDANRDIYIGGRNTQGVADNFADVVIEAVVIWATSPTALQIATMTTAMNAL